MTDDDTQFTIDISPLREARMIFMALCPTLEVNGVRLNDADTARKLHGVFSNNGTFLGLSIMLGNSPDEELWYMPIYRAPENAYSMALDAGEDMRARVGLPPIELTPDGVAVADTRERR